MNDAITQKCQGLIRPTHDWVHAPCQVILNHDTFRTFGSELTKESGKPLPGSHLANYAAHGQSERFTREPPRYESKRGTAVKSMRCHYSFRQAEAPLK